MVRNNAIATALCCICQVWTYDDTARLGVGQLLLVSGIADKADVAGTGRLQRSQAGNFQLGIAMQLPAQGGNDGGQLEFRHPCGTKQAYLAAAALRIFKTFSVMSCRALL